MSSRFHALALAGAAALLSGCVADRAAAPEVPNTPNQITGGIVDATNTYSNVGAFLVKSPTTGLVYGICSGTLISPTVFLTAAHCIAYFEQVLAPEGWTAWISFSNPLTSGDATGPAPVLIPVTDIVANPDYTRAQGDAGDVGVLIVEARYTVGITPATLPTLNLLDQLAAQNGLKSATFIASGYGVQDRVVGGGQPYFNDANPLPRLYSIEAFNALNKGYLRLTQNPSLGYGGACYGDSGGPNFLSLDGQLILVAVTVTGDIPCRATNVVYRLDTASAREFLSQFVTLP